MPQFCAKYYGDDEEGDVEAEEDGDEPSRALVLSLDVEVEAW